MQSTKIEPFTQPQLKYSIKEKLNSLPKADYGSALKYLINKMAISRGQFYRIISTPKNSTSSATSDQLIIIAQFLGCTVDELINK